MKKKICLVIPSLHVGGMERVMNELAGYFAGKKEIDLHLVLYGKKPVVFYKLPQNITVHKPLFIFNEKKRFWLTIKTLRFLRKKIKKIQPDTILSFGEYWNSFVLLALLGLRFSVFVSDRCQPDKSLGKIHDLLRIIFYRKAKGIIVQTKVARKMYQKFLPPKKIYVIGNPIRKIINKEVILKQNIVLSIGRLIKSKHHDELIKLFVRIGIPDWKLVIVGDDAIKQQNKVKLYKLIQELDAGDKVILAGMRNNVEQFYLESKIFAFTSSSEGFPNVIGEALSSGLPVVSYDCVAGPSEMIKDGVNGFLVPVFDDNLFQQKLQLLIENEASRKKMAENAKESISEFSVEKIGQQYLDFILS